MNNYEKIESLFEYSDGCIPKNIIDNFKTWTGGWDPKEEGEEKVEEYIEFAMTGSLNSILTDYDSFMTYLYGEGNY